MGSAKPQTGVFHCYVGRQSSILFTPSQHMSELGTDQGSCQHHAHSRTALQPLSSPKMLCSSRANMASVNLETSIVHVERSTLEPVERNPMLHGAADALTWVLQSSSVHKAAPGSMVHTF